MFFRFFLKEERDRELRNFCRKRVPDFSCLKVEKSVSSRFEVSFGHFQQFFAAGPKSSRGLVGVIVTISKQHYVNKMKSFLKDLYKEYLKQNKTKQNKQQQATTTTTRTEKRMCFVTVRVKLTVNIVIDVAGEDC